MTEHLLSRDEIDALLHTAARDERPSSPNADESIADPEALGQLWRLFLTTTAERWSEAWGRKLAAGAVRVQWGTAEELMASQPAGALVDVLLAGKMEGAASGGFWAATSVADATAFTSLAGGRGPWGDLDDHTESAGDDSGGGEASARGESSRSKADGDGSPGADVPTGAAEAFLKAITSEMADMSEQLFPQRLTFSYDGKPALVSGLKDALGRSSGGEGGDPVLVELSCRLSGDGVEVPVTFLLDEKSTETLLFRFDEQAAEGAAAGTGLSSAVSGAGGSRPPVQPGAGGAGSSFQHGIGGGDRPPDDAARGVTISPARFLPLGETGRGEGEQNLDLILDVPLEVRVELGRTHMQIRDVLDLGRGSVVELDKLAGEPVDVLVNGKLLAKGEVVVIDENFGVKVTDIVSPMERIRDLQ